MPCNKETWVRFLCHSMRGYVVVKVTLAQITLQIFWLSFLVLFYLLFILIFIFKATCSLLFTDGS